MPILRQHKEAEVADVSVACGAGGGVNSSRLSAWQHEQRMAAGEHKQRKAGSCLRTHLPAASASQVFGRGGGVEDDRRR
jgi:hypothetical protein